jgi:hypothetical protein
MGICVDVRTVRCWVGEFKQGVGEAILCDEAISGRPVSYNLYVEKCSCKNVILYYYTVYMA